MELTKDWVMWLNSTLDYNIELSERLLKNLEQKLINNPSDKNLQNLVNNAKLNLEILKRAKI